MFTDNDFKGNDGNVVSTNTISARFINKVEPKDYDSTVLEAKFEVEGIIEKIEDEVAKCNGKQNFQKFFGFFLTFFGVFKVHFLCTSGSGTQKRPWVRTDGIRFRIFSAIRNAMAVF